MADNDNFISPNDALQWAQHLTGQHPSIPNFQNSLLAQVQAAPLETILEGVQPTTLIDLQKSANRDTVVFTDQSKKQDSDS